jgi:hypothetical protein
MADLILRDATLERMKSMAGCATCDNYNYVRCRACIWDDVMNIVEEMSEVDAVPVVHGRWSEKRWITDDDWGVINHRAIVCSACKGEIADGEQTRYCPMCGARMDAERRDSE